MGGIRASTCEARDILVDVRAVDVGACSRMKDLVINRVIDSGAPLGLELAGDDGATRFVVHTRLCATPTCPMVHLQVRATAPRVGVEDEAAAPGLAIDLHSVHGRAEVATDVPSPFSPEVTRRIVEAIAEPAFVARLRERWRRARAIDEPGQVPAGWSPGEMVGFSEVFPSAFDLVLEHEGVRYLVSDQHCITAQCPCSDVVLTFIDVDRGEHVGHARVSIGGGLTIGEGDARGRALGAAFLADDQAQDLPGRFRRSRAFAKRARRAAIRAGGRSLRASQPRGGGTLRLRAWLRDTWPCVWRRLEVPSTATLGALDGAVLSALDRRATETSSWSLVTPHHPALAYASERGGRLERRATLASTVRVGDTLVWSAGTPGGWEVEVVVEAELASSADLRPGRVLDGEHVAPPPGVAAPGTFGALLSALGDDASPRHAEAVRVLGASFDELASPEGLEDDELAGSDEPETAAHVAAVLEAHGMLMMERTSERLRELGAPAVSALLEILAREPIIHEGRREPSPAQVSAIRYLGGHADARVVPALLEVFTRFEPDCPIAREAAIALGMADPTAVEEIEAAYAKTTEPLHRAFLRDALLDLGVDDEPVLSLFTAAVEGHEPLSAQQLAGWGDAAHVPVLEAALQRRLAAGLLDEAQEAVEALEELGADVRAHRSKLEALLRAEAAKARPRPAAATPPAKRPGRNDPCWCGSGKKYKKCHLSADERAS